ncbi:hypothetical protein [Streptomyces sp. MMS20-AI2-20]|uniref:hypothetical protein n=1 Tax=Streptomyces sp. MMS20-AI2-20 TaxID=2925835 RepID=UPI001F6213AB|nr:hypothetical protein [Streptomyces sp. MMS20-AI2-20]MCI4146610.1 hypothetical protein [Streptomyces sp. MMS20-AI2-20]
MDPKLATFLEVLLGVRPAQARGGRVVGEVAVPHEVLVGVLEDFERFAGVAGRGVSGAVEGEWEERFRGVMRAFSGGEGLEYVRALVAGAGELASFAREYAAQVEKTNASIKWHALRLVVEIAAVMALAWLNPLGAMLQLLRLQALYRLVMQNILARLLVWVASRAGAMVAVETALGVAIEKFSLMEAGAKGFRSAREKEYLRQAAVAGAAGGAVGWVLPAVGGAVVNGVRRWLRGAGGGPGGRFLVRELDEAVGRPPVSGGVVTSSSASSASSSAVSAVVAGGGRGVGEGVSGSFGREFAVSVGRMADVLEKSWLGPGSGAGWWGSSLRRRGCGSSGIWRVRWVGRGRRGSWGGRGRRSSRLIMGVVVWVMICIGCWVIRRGRCRGGCGMCCRIGWWVSRLRGGGARVLWWWGWVRVVVRVRRCSRSLRRTGRWGWGPVFRGWVLPMVRWEVRWRPVGRWGRTARSVI